jgi:hypothetical protein
MTKYYLEAFQRFSGAQPSDYQYLPETYGVYCIWQEKVYLVRSYNDMLDEYRHIFEKESYSEVAVTPPPLWRTMLLDGLETPYEDFMITYFREWCNFWDNQRGKIKGGEQRYMRFRQEAWEELQMLIHLADRNLENFLDLAEDINDMELSPLVAFTIRELYSDPEEFLTECIDTLFSDDGHAWLGEGGDSGVEEVEVKPGEEVRFVVYHDTIDYDYILQEIEGKKAEKGKGKTESNPASKSEKPF